MELTRRFRKSTIKDVARQAGVSTTTVSVFVSGRENVCSPETAERIRSAVSELNYTPSSLISSVQTKITQTIGVCMQNPLQRHILYGNLFFERLWRGIASEVDADDYALLQYPASARQSARVEPFLDGRVDGILFHEHDNTRPAQIAAAGMPIVLLTRSLNLPDGCGAVYADEKQIVELALSHLWELGHRRIAHIAGPVGHDRPSAINNGFLYTDDVALQRLREYEAWMRSRNVYDPSLIGYADSWRAERVADIAQEWHALPEPPTAVFCANDVHALALMEKASGLRWRVPDELSVIGVDNSPRTWESDPALTSIDTRLEEVGREGVRCLLRLLHGAPMEECRVRLSVSQLIVRGSTAPRS